MLGQDVCFYRKCLHMALDLVIWALYASDPFLCHPSCLTLHGSPLACFHFVLCTKPSWFPHSALYLHPPEQEQEQGIFSFQKSRIWPQRLLLMSNLMPASLDLVFVPLCLFSVSLPSPPPSPSADTLETPSSWTLPLFVSAHWSAVWTYWPSSCLSSGCCALLKSRDCPHLCSLGCPQE